MKKNACPKCGSTEIYRIPNSLGYPELNIPAGITIFSAIKVTRYACGHCGFVEYWIDEPEDLEKLKKKYGK